MGQSATATLFYGYLIDEEDPFLEDFDMEEWDELYAEKKGVAPPSDEYSSGSESLYRAYWKDCNTLIDDEVCTIETHCSTDYPMYYVAIKESMISAGRGLPSVVSDLEVDGMWAHDLVIFSEVLDLPFAPSQWYLVSYLGS